MIYLETPWCDGGERDRVIGVCKLTSNISTPDPRPQKYLLKPPNIPIKALPQLNLYESTEVWKYVQIFILFIFPGYKFNDILKNQEFDSILYFCVKFPAIWKGIL